MNQSLLGRAMVGGGCLLVLAAFAHGTLATAADYQPIAAYLQKHCHACHGQQDPKAGLSLVKFRSSDDVLKNRKAWDNIVDMVESGTMPPEKRPRPSVDETSRFLAAVRGVYEEFERNGKPDPGQVTMRRLNRAEYANTVRDLFYGLDINPAEDFPSDDVGHGFDNIGDVLSLSPVLMERYLAAAENITQRAILANPPKVNQRGVGIRYTQPAAAKIPMQGEYRVVSTKPSKEAIETGPIFAEFRMTADDDYIFRFGCYAERENDLPVKVSVLASGRQIESPSGDEQMEPLWGLALNNLRPCIVLGTFEVTAREAKKQQTFEVRIPPTAGIDRMAVALHKTPEGTPPATVYLRYFNMEGPLDVRPVSQRRVLAVTEGKPRGEQTREALAKFVSRAYRRPASKAEVERLARLVDAVEAQGEKWEAGMQLAMQAVLTSPKFLFRAELDQRPDSNEAHPIDEFQLASRLSYFLWSSMPDDELFELARQGRLSPNLDAQVRRMLQDGKSRSLVDQFAMQWLQLGRLKSHSPDPQMFPTFKEPLRNAMLKETQMFMDAIIREDRSILEIIDADFTFLNGTLARHYGVYDTAGNAGGRTRRPGGRGFRGDQDWERVTLGDGLRGGILTQASVLTVTSNPTRTSPVKRGKWVLEQLLGTPPPPPPPNVPELEQQKTKLTGTLRQQMEQHRANVACANCHAKMDPLGFAFENFDAIGAFRAKDGGNDIDASGTLPDGQSFQGPAELRAILKEKKDLFARCLAEKLLIFALGRGLEYYDKRAVDQVVDTLKKEEYKFSSLCAAIARSDPFRMRRGRDQVAADQ